MAIELDSVSSWPALKPEQSLEPGKPHFCEDVGRLVREQHYLLAYHGCCHVEQTFGQLWEGGLGGGTGIPLCRGVTGSFVLVATYLIRPMRHAQKLQAVTRCDSDQGGTVRVKVVESAIDLDIAVSAGSGEVDSGVTATIDRGDQVTTIEVYLRAATSIGGTYLTLRSFYLADADLTVGDLP